MKIYDRDKTKELKETEIDRELGHLVEDRLFVAHHDATPFIKGKSAREKAVELTASGSIVKEISGKLYVVDREYVDGGQEVTEIVDEPDIEAREAYDEYEDIRVYIPYTSEELNDRRRAKLRRRRETECFSMINRGQLWYDGLSAEQKTELDKWYKAWLDVTDTLTVPDKPEWLR